MPGGEQPVHHCVFPLHSRALLQVTWAVGKSVLWAYLTCIYRDAIFFASDQVCLLINALSLTGKRFPLARDGPKRRTVRGFPHIMLWLPQLLLHQPKPILGRSHDEDAKLWQHTPSSYIPTQASPALPSKLYACSSLPTHSLHPSHSWAQPKFS